MFKKIIYLNYDTKVSGYKSVNLSKIDNFDM